MTNRDTYFNALSAPAFACSATASPPRRRESACTISRFWPHDDTHELHSFRLPEPELIVGSEPAEDLRAVVLTADAIRSLEDVQALSKDDCAWAIKALREESARRLDRAASKIQCATSATSLRLRAQALHGIDASNAIRRAAALDENVLVAFCGNLSTWHAKSLGAFHSAFFAHVDSSYREIIRRLDAGLDDSMEHLRRVVRPQIGIAPPSPLQICDLMLCGGEANRYPKHFAYFLPEDEKVSRADAKKTVVFRNTYLELYKRVSEPFGRATWSITGAEALISDQTVQDHLLLWFRSHDICHGVRLPHTDLSALRVHGRWNSMVLQEAIADIFGLLLMMEGPWLKIAPVSAEIGARTFLTEMLRYVRRGPHLFPDSGAAFLELCFLEANGSIAIDLARRRICTSVERLIEGARQLARSLAGTALDNNVDGTRALLAAFSATSRTDLVARFEACFGLSRGSLDYIQEAAPK